MKFKRESIFRLTIKNETLHESNNNSGARLVNFAIYDLVDQRTMLSHR